MKKLFIILLLLWAGVAYGASTTLSGMGSTGLSATGSTGFLPIDDYTTTIFSYNFNVADDSDPTSVGAPTDTWSSEYDADGDGNITGNAYMCTINSTNSINLRKTITTATHLQVSYSLKISTLSLLSASGKYILNMSIRNNSGEVVSVSPRRTGTEVDSLLIFYNDDAGGHSTYPSMTFAADTDYSIVIIYEIASSDGANDGKISVIVDGNSLVNLTSLDNDTIAGITELRLGANYIPDASASGNITNDSVVVKIP